MIEEEVKAARPTGIASWLSLGTTLNRMHTRPYDVSEEVVLNERTQDRQVCVGVALSSAWCLSYDSCQRSSNEKGRGLWSSCVPCVV